MKNKKAFTLMELLTVIAVMAVLAGLLLPALNRARASARTAAAESMIASLQVALSMYNMDYGVYPASSATGTQRNGNSFHADFDGGEPNNLVAALTAMTKGGPYMEFRGRDLDENPNYPQAGRNYVVLDPWGRAYVYTARRYSPSPGDWANVNLNHGPFYPDDDNTENNTYNIFSLGPDGHSVGETLTAADDWNNDALLSDADAGHWRGAAETSDRYDDINSWDGARR